MVKYYMIQNSTMPEQRTKQKTNPYSLALAYIH